MPGSKPQRHDEKGFRQRDGGGTGAGTGGLVVELSGSPFLDFPLLPPLPGLPPLPPLKPFC